MKILTEHSLANYNTFGVDVTAKFFVRLNSIEDIDELFSDKEIMKESKLILGGGSNILFTKDFDGLVCKMLIGGIEIIEENDRSVLIEAGAGVLWDDLVNYAIENNFGGIENLILIPGTVGAAPIQNIGAYGQKLSDTIHSVDGIFSETGEIKSFLKHDCKFGYRDSIFKNEIKNKFIITSVRLRLIKNPSAQLAYEEVKDEIEKQKINNPTIKDVSGLIEKIREIKLPDPKKINNAGSFFKNPVITVEKYKSINDIYPDLKCYPAEENCVKIPAAWLIEKCGFKGKRVGNVASYPNQPLVIVNYGATGKEVLEFANIIKESVYKMFDIQLEYEVNIF